MSFLRYERYRDSGVEWLGEVPEHWPVQRLKTLFSLMSRPVREADGIITAFRDGQVTLRSLRREEGFTNAVKEIGYQGVRCGDLVIHAMDAFAGAIGVSDSDGKATPVYSVCMPRNPHTLSRYYGYLLRYMALSGYVNSLAKGIRERSTDFRWADAGCVEVPVPSESEQSMILTFLDQETAKIDAHIDEQQMLIDLLMQKRQVVLSQAVTKGLNVGVRMRESGQLYIRDIPRHWEMVRLKHVCSFITSGPRGWSDFISEVGSLFVQSGDLNDQMGIDFEDCKRVRVEESVETTRTRLSNRDVVVCITGAKTGNVAVCLGLSEPAYVNQHLCLVRPTNAVEPRFLGMLLKSEIGRRHFDLSQYGLKQGLGLEDVREAPVPLPPIEEQQAIVSYVDSYFQDVHKLIQAGQSVMALLQERRSALIAAAVTGEIDVRNYIPHEPTASKEVYEPA